MIRRSLTGFVATFLMFAGVMPAAVNAQPAKGAKPIQVGLVSTFFNDVEPVFIEIAIDPFGKLMKEMTGLEGKLSYKDDAFTAAKRLDANDLQVAVFHGHEFAWVQKKYPNLKTLMIATNKHHDVKAFVVVHKNNPAKSINDLRGKNLDLPMGAKEHARVFLNQLCSDNAQQGWSSFFKVSRPKSSVLAMDNVATGKSDAVLMDTLTLEFYKDVKRPVFEKNLRVLETSNAFPEPVIVYKEGNVDAKTIKMFRDGLANAHNMPDGKDFLAMWQIDRFQEMPADYSKTLATTLQRYPLPASVKVQAME